MKAAVLPRRVIPALRWLAVAAWASVIFGMSSVPGSRIPGRFGPLAHFVEYALLAALVYWALPMPTGAKRLLAAVAIASAYGVSDEIHQMFVPLRTPDIADWAVDTAGAAAGAIVARAGLRTAPARQDQ